MTPTPEASERGDALRLIDKLIAQDTEAAANAEEMANRHPNDLSLHNELMRDAAQYRQSVHRFGLIRQAIAALTPPEQIPAQDDARAVEAHPEGVELLREIAAAIVRDATPVTDRAATCFVPMYQVEALGAQLRNLATRPSAAPEQITAQGQGVTYHGPGGCWKPYGRPDPLEGHAESCACVHPGDNECNCHKAYGFDTREEMDAAPQTGARTTGDETREVNNGR